MTVCYMIRRGSARRISLEKKQKPRKSLLEPPFNLPQVRRTPTKCDTPNPTVLLRQLRRRPRTPAASNNRVRHDPPWLSASDIARKETNAEEKLQELSSNCVTTRKAALVAGADPAAPGSMKSFVMVNLDIVNSAASTHKTTSRGP
ncbi:unnamed protein product [Ixodes persulcatus]